MNSEDGLVKHMEGELVAPKIELSDITTLAGATRGLKILRKEVEKEHNKALEESIQNASKRVLKQGLFGKYEVDYLDNEFFKQSHQLNLKIVQDLYPTELEAIVDNIIGIPNVNKQFKKISEEVSIFLRYFFLTPLNEANWERIWKEIVPVTESTSILFRAYSQETVRPFEKSGHEKGSSQMESMQMIPFALGQEHIDFYVKRILGAAQDYSVQIRRFADMLSRFKQGETTPDNHLDMDIRIMNYCLEKMGNIPYTPATGAFAIQLGTATSRIGKVLERINEELNNTAENFLGESRISEKYFSGMVEREGFKIRYDKETRDPTYALRKVKDCLVAHR